MGIFESIDVSIDKNNIIKNELKKMIQCCKSSTRLISTDFDLTSISCDKMGNSPKKINIQFNSNNSNTNIITKRRTSFNNYYNYKISESSVENTNKENYLKFEQSKSNANEVTLSNTNLFGQNSVNFNKTNNNINNVNDIVIIENNLENTLKHEEKTYENNLILEIMTSWNLPEGYKLTIRNKHGLENSLINRIFKEREKEERSTVYFGFQREEDLNTNPNIDYLLYPKEDFYDKKFIGKHFQIRYDTINKLYYIKDLGFGFGTFIKLTKDIKINDNFLINIGETYIVFSLNPNEINEENNNNIDEYKEEEKNKNIINIKVFSGDEKCDNYNFDNFSKKNILIGRNAICDVIIEDKMLSRVHCSLFYVENEKEEEKGWYLKDGNLNGKKSTNDTWFYSAEETLIENDMIFKTNHNLFKCILQREEYD